MSKVYNLRPSKKDFRDYKFSAPLHVASNLPKKIDLRSEFLAPFDQGQLGACTGNAYAALKEFLLKKYGKTVDALSRLFIYYEERVIEGTVNEDSGAEMRDGMKVLQKNGVCKESLWPYDINTFTHKPTDAMIADAANYKITSYASIPDLNGIKSCLAEGFPVAMGFYVYQEFENIGSTGILKMPKSSEQPLGGHAVVIVGYKDTTKTSGYLIVRNSWGAEWGDGGYFYMPYKYLHLAGFDLWTAR
jgi:C1A family cysteine protease